MTNIINNLDTLEIESVPFRVILTDALVGAGFPTPQFAQWAASHGLAKFSGDQHNESWVWVREALAVLEMDALMSLYQRARKMVH